MRRRRKVMAEGINVQTYVDIRHLAFAVKKFHKHGQYTALGGMSSLVRAIIEDWIMQVGPCDVDTIENAMEILGMADLAPERIKQVRDEAPKELITSVATAEIKDNLLEAVGEARAKELLAKMAEATKMHMNR